MAILKNLLDHAISVYLSSPNENTQVLTLLPGVPTDDSDYVIEDEESPYYNLHIVNELVANNIITRIQDMPKIQYITKYVTPSYNRNEVVVPNLSMESNEVQTINIPISNNRNYGVSVEVLTLTGSQSLTVEMYGEAARTTKMYQSIFYESLYKDTSQAWYYRDTENTNLLHLTLKNGVVAGTYTVTIVLEPF